MSLSRAKGIKTEKFHDKENIHLNSNTINDFKSVPKEGVKTGVEIRNKLKGKNLFKPPNQPVKKQQIRKNSHLMQKMHKKVLQQQQANNCRTISREECNLSSSSSVRSIKSVTFSLDHSVENERSLSQSSSTKGLRQKSILKNKLSQKDKCKMTSQKQSLASSHCSHLKNTDQAVQNPTSNSIVMQKYQRLLKELKLNSQKYTDSIYPPCEQSMFLKSSYTRDFLQKLSIEGYRIKWIRLPQLYPSKHSCLWHPSQKSTITKGFIHSSDTQNNYISTVFNSINKSYMMEKFFQNQSLCSEGIYYVKMHQTQTNHWKYVIVDDFVPVVVSLKRGENGKIIRPAFLDVATQNDVVELWPFLLQKAFAKYYSTYDTLIKGNSLDFLEEVTGNYLTTFFFDSMEETSPSKTLQRQTLNNLIKNPYNIMLAETKQGLIYPIRCSSSEQIEVLDIDNNYNPQTINRQNFQSFFTKLHIVQAKKYTSLLTCLIKQQHLVEKVKQKQHPQNKKPFILRSFTLQQRTSCIMGLTQKEERFHRKSNKSSKIKQNYTYSWMRMILVMKESTGYRWVNCCYERKKILKIQEDLEPGEYFVIILPEWTIKPYDLKLTLFSNTNTMIERKSYDSHAQIIEQSCMDLAQRYGKLTQINSNICSYNYIDYNVGFIIENINNQKTSGEIKILRTIDGLEAYNITPVNPQFDQKSKLQIKIPSLESYTVVLKVSGGVDKSFLQQFDFGL